MAVDNPAVDMGLVNWDEYKNQEQPAAAPTAQAPAPGQEFQNNQLRKQKIRSALKGMADARSAPVQPLIQLPESKAPGPKEINFMEA
ncbi:MAG: hypothetical protein Unbinned3972contig1001_15 [Prokaryotic dsDNA virus sp.]|nr:MAG: hypothetical protein Unbinned3972contig1001_15 [Prokaryotic dsDNA virus sp.]